MRVTSPSAGDATVGSVGDLQLDANFAGSVTFAAQPGGLLRILSAYTQSNFTVDEFKAGDAIDLLGVQANQYSYNVKKDILTLYNLQAYPGPALTAAYNAPQIVGAINLDLTSSNGDSLILTPDGTTGTDITMGPFPSKRYHIAFTFSQSLNASGHLEAGWLECQIDESGVAAPIWSWQGDASQDDVFPLTNGPVTVGPKSWKASSSLGLVLGINNRAGNPKEQSAVEFHVGNVPPDGMPIPKQWSNQSESCLVASPDGFFVPFEQALSLLDGLDPASVTKNNLKNNANVADLVAYLNGHKSSENGSSTAWSFNVSGDSVSQAKLGIEKNVRAKLKDSTFDFTLDRPLEKEIKVLYTVIELNAKNMVDGVTTRETYIDAKDKNSVKILIDRLATGQEVDQLDPSIVSPACNPKYYTSSDYYAGLPEFAADTYNILLDGYQALYTGSTRNQGWYYDSNNSNSRGNLANETLLFDEHDMSLEVNHTAAKMPSFA